MVSRHVVTLANSIVGVSVLAMPFCFKQCGIILASIMLIMSAALTRLVCYFLIKASVVTRRRTFELLAYHTFGPAGKFTVEISMIGFLIGNLIAFMVVMGDLGPQIVSELFIIQNNGSLRTVIMTGLSLFVALPLGLLRNIDSLSTVSIASVFFYAFLVMKILSDSIGPLWDGSYIDKIEYWRPAGVLQCIPIFSMAMACQTQIFGIYDLLPDPSIQKMNKVIKQSVLVCTCFYICIGCFGYIAFCHNSFGGNILMSLTSDWSTQVIKLCFLLSVVFSVPLALFPCRASLHSLLFRRAHLHHQIHDMSTNYIPESRLRFLTVIIIGSTLVIGILIPNIEFILGLVGSTTGSVICIIFPSIMFIKVTSKNTTERLIAQFVFFVGIGVMISTSYATLYAVEQAKDSPSLPVIDFKHLKVTEQYGGKLVKSPSVPPAEVKNANLPQPANPPAPVQMVKDNLDEKELKEHVVEVDEKKPEETFPKDINRPKPESEVKIKEDLVQPKAPMNPEKYPKAERIKKADDPQSQPIVPMKPENENKEEIRFDQNRQSQHVGVGIKYDNKDKAQAPEVDDPLKKPAAENSDPKRSLHDVKKNEEPQAAVDDSPVEGPAEKRNGEAVAEGILKKLEEQQIHQKKILEEQKEILEELKQHKQQDEAKVIEKEKKKDPEPVPIPVQQEPAAKPPDVMENFQVKKFENVGQDSPKAPVIPLPPEPVKHDAERSLENSFVRRDIDINQEGKPVYKDKENPAPVAVESIPKLDVKEKAEREDSKREAKLKVNDEKTVDRDI